MSALITTDVDEAAAALRNGGLVAFPTETVYGLGAAADNPEAVRRIFEVKNRPADHPVIVHVAYSAGGDVDDALKAWVDEVPEYARLLVATYWPGPLTLVLHRRSGVGEVTSGGRPTIAVRSPTHPLARALLEAFGSAIAAPSANRFGRVSPTTAAHVVSELAEVLDPVTDRILDGGPCDVGVESTIVDCTGPAPRLLRSGSVTVEDIESVTGQAVLDADPSVRAPGTLAAHYAPTASVIVVDESGLDAVVASHQASGLAVGLLAGSEVSDRRGTTRLAAPTSTDEYARQLYAALRLADDQGISVIVAVPPPDRGVGQAVCDRLRRAATGSGR